MARMGEPFSSEGRGAAPPRNAPPTTAASGLPARALRGAAWAAGAVVLVHLLAIGPLGIPVEVVLPGGPAPRTLPIAATALAAAAPFLPAAVVRHAVGLGRQRHFQALCAAVAVLSLGGPLRQDGAALQAVLVAFHLIPAAIAAALLGPDPTPPRTA
jgi:hypothetical protein